MPLGAEKRMERRGRILSAARRLISERGYEHVSMRDLAGASGVTIPTLYNGFGSKAALLTTAVEELLRQELVSVDDDAEEQSVSRAFLVAETLVQGLTRDPGYSSTLLDSLRQSSARAGMGATIRSDIQAAFQRCVEQMEARGELVEYVEPHQVAHQLADHAELTAQAWAQSELPTSQLRARMLFGTCLLLGGASRGDAVELVEQCLRELAEERRQRRVATA